MHSYGRAIFIFWALLYRSGSYAERSTGYDDDTDDRSGRKPWHNPKPSGGRLMDGKGDKDLQREMAECEYTKQRSRRLETQISKLFQTIHNRSAELAVAKSELELVHESYAKELNAKEDAWQSALDSARAKTAERAAAEEEGSTTNSVSSESCSKALEEHREALETLRSQYEDELSAKEEAWGAALERAETELRAHTASASASSGGGSSTNSVSGASDDKVTAAELEAMRKDYEAQLAAKEEAWAAAHAEVTERLNAATGGHPAGGGNRRQLSAVGALSGDSSAVQAQEDRRAGAHGGLRRRG